MVTDHIIPLALGGETILDNLALCCYRCNEFKRARIEGIDADTNKTVPLYHPSRHMWREHFEWSEDGLRIVGKTPNGRATIDALRLNNEWIISARRIWIAAGLHPPLE